MSLNNNILATLGTSSVKNNTSTADKITRRSANYHPSVWGDKFLAYNNYTSNGKGDGDTDTVKLHEQMKEDIKMMLMKKTGEEEEAKQVIIMVDDLQKLGISYHFEAEIDVALHQISQNYHYIYNDSADNFDDLHDIALCFRLLRQNGHNVCTVNVFRKYMDSNGKLKQCLIEDLKGMLSLYEAAHFRVHEEEILEEAVSFTTLHLLEHLKKQQQQQLHDDHHIYNPTLASHISHALKYPIRKNLNRVGARHYISYIDQHMINNIDHIDSHSKLLVDFAKLDFNLLQTMYQQELGHITRWWKDLNFCEKLPFARDRVVECYFWMLGVYFEPKYNMARRFLTKVIMLASVVDDIYDLYATYEELLLFTDAIEKWDTNCLNMLPEYMQVCYQALLDTYIEMEKVLDKEAGTPSTYRVSEAKNSFKRLAKAYLDEAKWYKEGYFPTTVEEYMKVGLVTSGSGTMTIHCFVGMGDEATREVFHWVSNDPLIVRASGLIARLCDDMAGHEFEQEKGDIPSAVECYMKQHCATKEEAIAELQKKVVNAWKDINQEYYLCVPAAPNNNNNIIPLSLLARIDNLTRSIHVVYDVGDDGYTHSSTRTKDLITSVLIEPFPL